MQLKTYNEANIRVNLGGRKSVLPVLAINIKSGGLRFNSLATDLLQLSSKSEVLIHQDEDSPADWYLEVVKKDGIPLRNKKTGGTNEEFYIQSTLLVKAIVASVEGLPETFKGGRLQIGKEPVKNGGHTLWPLLTGRLIADLNK